MKHEDKPVFLCFKWGTGYPPRYTNILYRALSDRMNSSFRFVCMTDDKTGLAAGIETIPLPDFVMDRSDWQKGMWPKICAFAPGLFKDGTPVIMMDVDVLIVRDLTPLFDCVRRTQSLHIMQDVPDTLPRLFPRLWGKPISSNSSVVGFIAGTQDHLFEEFKDKSLAELYPVRNDQDYIHKTALNLQHFPFEWLLSFKKSLAWHFPINLLRSVPYPDGYIVIFHGKPNPEDMTQRPLKRWGSPEKFGFFPVKWIKEYWKKYNIDES